MEGLNPGDKVVALAAAAVAAAVVSGMAAGGIAGWLVKHKAAASVAGVIGGGVLGVLAGILVGRIIFPAAGGEVMIAKWGPGSLPLTLKGNIAAGLVTSFALCALTAFFTGTDIKTFYVPCVSVAAALSVILALLASLL
ncbi:MAG: hypothetical protein Q7R35_06590 [Elusimicrobiota bacterium]|nr:hypothetical protein [Elusimicrobiota bacterium]